MFTFKTEKPTGKYKSFFPSHHYIKMKKGQVGRITDSYPHAILFMVKQDITDQTPCEFKWITLKKKFETINLAKEWLNENYKHINDQFKLYSLK